MEVGEGLESDYHPLIVKIREKREERKKGEGSRSMAGGVEREWQGETQRGCDGVRGGKGIRHRRGDTGGIAVVERGAGGGREGKEEEKRERW